MQIYKSTYKITFDILDNNKVSYIILRLIKRKLIKPYIKELFVI